MLETGWTEVQFSKSGAFTRTGAVTPETVKRIYIWAFFDGTGCNLAGEPIICVKRLSAVRAV
jgi:hypothetical protein